MKLATHLLKFIFSFAVFLAIALAVASTTYQLFNPDGAVINWMLQLWNINPVLLIMLGGIVLLVLRWLSGVQTSRSVFR